MFVFYYAVLSEVSPPTALSPFAAAAITGGSPFRTTMLSWKYTAPAFVVPFAFTIDPRGLGLLLHSTPANVVWATASAVLGLVALAMAANGWMRSRLSTVERVLAAAAALFLFTPRAVAAATGGVLLLLLTARQWRRAAASEIP
jgi:TRAP-type uncharacterized transport system fused permease subunit